MATEFRAVRVKARSEFDWLIEHVTHEIYRARDHWDVWVGMEAALGLDEYAVEINQTPAFWEVTRRAHQDAVVLGLGRLYDPHATATSLGNLLQTMKENSARAGTSFPAAIATLSASDLDADMASVSSQDPVVEKLLLWRNEYLAHRGTRHVTKGTFTSLPPLQKEELSGLLLKAITLMGKYREILGYPFLAWGHHEADEFKRLLLLLRAGRARARQTMTS